MSECIHFFEEVTSVDGVEHLMEYILGRHLTAFHIQIAEASTSRVGLKIGGLLILSCISSTLHWNIHLEPSDLFQCHKFLNFQ